LAEGLKSATPQQADHSGAVALSTEVCLNLQIEPPILLEICRYLGYPAEAVPAPLMVGRISEIITEARPSLRPRGAYALYAVSSRTAHLLQLDDTTISGNIGEYLQQADRVAVFAVTVGKEISHLAESAAKNDDALSAWVIDAVGSWAVESAADALMLHIRRHLQEGQELTLRYSPGYCGMDIAEQRKLFHLVQADSVDVTLMPSMLMHPLKSISGLVGLAPKEAVSHYRSPCDVCPRTGCHIRR